MCKSCGFMNNIDTAYPLLWSDEGNVASLHNGKFYLEIFFLHQ